MSVVLPVGRHSLEKEGEFRPYAAALSSEGEVHFIPEEDPTGERWNSDIDMRYFLFDVLANQRDSIRAGAVVATGFLGRWLSAPPGYPQNTYAIDVAIEHAEGVAVVVLLPYKKKRFGRISYGELSIWEDEERHIWTE